MLSLERARSFFPVVERVAYLDHASVGPISTRVVEALDRYAQEASRFAGLRREAQVAEVERVRGQAAALLGASPEEVAFVRNTTEGLGCVAAGLDWRPGDRVVTCDLEYASNLLPWRALAARGVETQVLSTDGRRLDAARVEEALGHPAVRLLTLSSVEFASGFRHDLPRLGAACRERGVLFCVDAMQSLGCEPLDVRACGVDFLACGGSKWLLSVDGCGIFYASRAVAGRLTPRSVGPRSVVGSDEDASITPTLRDDARRFEESKPNTPGIYALGAALDLLLELGPERVAGRVRELVDRLLAGLAARGAQRLTAAEPGARAGVVAFALPGEPAARTAARLAARGVRVSVRRGCVRASPHYYNQADEIDALLRALR